MNLQVLKTAKATTETTNLSSRGWIAAAAIGCLLGVLSPTMAQDEPKPAASVEQVRWKSEQQVRALLGDPKSVRGPIGTHATYELWQYEGFSVAFANNHAFHLFDENSLRKIQLEENR